MIKRMRTRRRLGPGGCGFCHHAGRSGLAGCGRLCHCHRGEDGGHLLRLRDWGGWLQGARSPSSGPKCRPGRQRCAGEAWGCRLHCLGWAELASCTLPGCARQCPREGTVPVGCIRVPGRTGLGLGGCARWAFVGFLGAVGVSWGVGLFVAVVCGSLGPGGGGFRVVGPSVGAVHGGGDSLSRGPGTRTRGECRPLGGGREGRGRGHGMGFVCGVSALVFACGGLHVLSRVGLEVWRWSLPSAAAAAMISQMRVCTWCTSWLVVGREYFRHGLRPTCWRILWTAW